MALIKCPECNTEVSSMAAACPKCAYPISISTTAVPVKIKEVISQTMESQEETIFAIKPSMRPAKSFYISSLIFFVFSLISNDGVKAFFGFSCFILLTFAITYHIKRNLRWYTLTSEKMVRLYEFISRREDVIPLSRIQNVTSQSGLMQSLWNCGDIVIESAGDRVGLIYLWNVENPQIRANAILEAVRRKTARQSP